MIFLCWIIKTTFLMQFKALSFERYSNMHEITEKLAKEKTYFWGIYEAAVLIEWNNTL